MRTDGPNRVKRGYGMKFTPRAFVSHIRVLAKCVRRRFGLERHEEYILFHIRVLAGLSKTWIRFLKVRGVHFVPHPLSSFIPYHC